MKNVTILIMKLINLSYICYIIILSINIIINIDITYVSMISKHN